MENYLIWSNQHRAWWGPGSCGYEKLIAKAGRYSRGHALSICQRAHDGRLNMPDGQPPEIPVRFEDAVGCIRW